MNVAYSHFDTAAYRRFRVERQDGAFNWHAAGVDAMTNSQRARWQHEFRARFSLLLGDLAAWERTDLAPHILETCDFDGYRRETIAFTTRPRLRALGHLLIPHDALQNGDANGVTHPAIARPTIVCLPGHGRGAESCLGIMADGTQRALVPAGEETEYQSDFALQCVARGYPTFVLEPIGFGARRDASTRARGAEATTCNRDAMAALMLGETLPGWRVWDTMRALDYLRTRSALVDARRLALMGISGGGLIALFTAALDPTVAACVVSGYFNTFAASVLALDHCSDNYVPGLLKLCEMPDLAALVAPRHLFVEGGHDDPIFPAPTFETAVAQARDIYHVFNASHHFEAEAFAGGHRFHGVGAFNFLESWRR